MIPTWLLSINFACLIPIILIGSVARHYSGTRLSKPLFFASLLMLAAALVGIYFDDRNASNYQYDLSGNNRFFIDYVCEKENLEPCNWETVRQTKTFDETTRLHWRARDYRFSFALLFNGIAALIFFWILFKQKPGTSV